MTPEATLAVNGCQILKDVVPIAYINAIRSTAANLLDTGESVDEIVFAMDRLEKQSSEAFYEFCLRLGNCCASQRIAFIPEVYNLCTAVFGASGCWLVDSAVFYNKRDVERLQYDWHIEKSYFPNAVDAITLWTPFLEDVSTENGPMLIADCPSEKDFNIQPGRRKEGHLTQMRISEDQLADCTIIPCVLSIGDAIAFDYNVAHRTSANKTDRPRVALVARFSCVKGKYTSGW
jgi:ectoine hydroxylase-related dioxygenase (phytanoyl-CoA dioxygenase family)